MIRYMVGMLGGISFLLLSLPAYAGSLDIRFREDFGTDTYHEHDEECRHDYPQRRYDDPHYDDYSRRSDVIIVNGREWKRVRSNRDICDLVRQEFGSCRYLDHRSHSTSHGYKHVVETVNEGYHNQHHW